MLARWSVNVVLLGMLAGFVTSCAPRESEAQAVWKLRNPPSALQRISERTQDIVLAAAEENWPRVYRHIRDLSDAWADYQSPTVVPVQEPRAPGTQLHGELGAALARLREAAAARQVAQTMRAAHELDVAAVGLFEYYHPALPPDLHRLRVLQRRVVLESAEGRLDATAVTLTQVRQAWERVRPVIEVNSSPDVVATFDDNLTAQQGALTRRDNEALASYARQAVAMLNDMQQLSFRASPYAWER
jgi:hypothetical protein